MKSFIVALLLSFVIVACGSNKQAEEKDEAAEHSAEVSAVQTYKFKVLGLEDQSVSDSVWKMIMQVEGVEQLLLSRDDSSVTLQVQNKDLDARILADEIESRGAKVLGQL